MRRVTYLSPMRRGIPSKGHTGGHHQHDCRPPSGRQYSPVTEDRPPQRASISRLRWRWIHRAISTSRTRTTAASGV